MKSRLLRSLIRDRVPRPDSAGEEWYPDAGEVDSVLEALRMHGLLSERFPAGWSDAKAATAWREAVDLWAERLLELSTSKNAFKCWFAVCFLGVTIQECASARFVRSFQVWFGKIHNIFQSPASQHKHIVAAACCASMSDLFIRASRYNNLKKEASSLAGKVVQHIAEFVDIDSRSMESVDLICTLIKIFPSLFQRHYDKLECGISLRILGGACNEHTLKKYASLLAMLPCVKSSEDSWKLLMQKLVITVSELLTDAFMELEDENGGADVMRLLIPLGTNPPLPLGGHARPSRSVAAVLKGSRIAVVPTISALLHCISAMLTGPYTGQVAVPVCALLALIQRVFQLDGTWQKSNFISTDLHQELVCSELPLIHSDFLELLVAMIDGIGSRLLPHSLSIARLVVDCFKRAAVPLLRIKVYLAMRLLLTSIGNGLSFYVVQELVSNAYNDLTDSYSNEAISAVHLSEEQDVPPSRSRSRKRKKSSVAKQQHLDTTETGIATPKRRKQDSSYQTDHSIRSDSQFSGDNKISTPYSVKIAALQALESLLVTGGSLKSEEWRREVELLLINVARSACDKGFGSKASPAAGEGVPSVATFQLAALKALLASFLSLSHQRPQHLSQGLELFHRGKLEAESEVAQFCTHALQALEVLIHPRVLSLDDPAYRSTDLSRNMQEIPAFGSVNDDLASGSRQRYPGSSFGGEDEDWIASSDDEQPLEGVTDGKTSMMSGEDDHPTDVAMAVNDTVASQSRNDSLLGHKVTTIDSPGQNNLAMDTLPSESTNPSGEEMNQKVVEPAQSGNIHDSGVPEKVQGSTDVGDHPLQATSGSEEFVSEKTKESDILELEANKASKLEQLKPVDDVTTVIRPSTSAAVHSTTPANARKEEKNPSKSFYGGFFWSDDDSDSSLGSMPDVVDADPDSD